MRKHTLFSKPLPALPVKTLHPHQAKAVAECVAALPKHKRVLLHAFMALGKTVMAKAIADALGRRLLILTDTVQLRTQMIAEGFPEGCCKTRQGFYRTLKQSNGKFLIIIDEAHKSGSESYRKILDAHPNAWALGLTATPRRGDGRPLFPEQEKDMDSRKAIFRHRVTTMGVLEATKAKPKPFLVLPLVRTTEFDLRDMTIVRGEYNEVQSMNRMVPLVGDAMQIYQEFPGQTLICCVNVPHARAMEAVFAKAGIGVKVAESNDKESQTYIENFVAGEFPVLVTINMCSEGFNYPDLQNMIMARPTVSVVVYLQQGGRLMRIPKKAGIKKRLFDMAGNFHRHGALETEFDWVTGRALGSAPKKRCFECGTINEPDATVCVDCGADLTTVALTKSLTEVMILEMEGQLVAAEEAREKRQIKKEMVAKKAAAREAASAAELKADLVLVKEARRMQTIVAEHLILPILETPPQAAKRIGMLRPTITNVIGRLKNNPEYRLTAKGEKVTGRTGMLRLTTTKMTPEQRNLVMIYAKAWVARPTDRAVSKMLGLNAKALTEVRSGKNAIESIGFGGGSKANFLNAKYPVTQAEYPAIWAYMQLQKKDK